MHLDNLWASCSSSVKEMGGGGCVCILNFCEVHIIIRVNDYNSKWFFNFFFFPQWVVSDRADLFSHSLSTANENRKASAEPNTAHQFSSEWHARVASLFFLDYKVIISSCDPQILLRVLQGVPKSCKAFHGVFEFSLQDFAPAMKNC